jgi:hypothetical protein
MVAGRVLVAARRNLALDCFLVFGAGMEAFVGWGRVDGTLAVDVVAFEGGGVVAGMDAVAVVCR